METTMRIAHYVLVSTPGQMEQYGPGRQRDEVRAYLERRGTVGEVVEFLEPGISADALDKRTAVHDLLLACAEHRVDMVIVDSVDRLAREVGILLWLCNEILRAGVPITVVSSGTVIQTLADLNGGDPTMKAMVVLLGLMAEYEKFSIKRRLAGGRLAKARRGGHAAGCPGLGFKVVRDQAGKGRLVQDPERVELVRRIYRMREEQGMDYSAIAGLLNQEGVPSPRKKSWHASTVRYILQNPAYRGLVRYRPLGEENEKVAADWRPVL